MSGGVWGGCLGDFLGGCLGGVWVYFWSVLEGFRGQNSRKTRGKQNKLIKLSNFFNPLIFLIGLFGYLRITLQAT